MKERIHHYKYFDMKQKTNASIFFTILIAIVFTSCKNETKKDEPSTTDVVKTEIMPAYDATLDPVNVEAKFLKMHKDTLGIKLYEVTLNPGDSVGIHNHPDHVIYFAQGGKLRLYAKDGKSEDVEVPTGAAILSPTTSHYGLNIGTTPVKMIVTDIYRPRS